MTADCYKLNQVGTPIAFLGPNVVSLLEQVNTALGSCCELLTCQMLFLCAVLPGPPETGATSTLSLPVIVQDPENLVFVVRTASPGPDSEQEVAFRKGWQ